MYKVQLYRCTFISSLSLVPELLLSTPCPALCMAEMRHTDSTHFVEQMVTHIENGNNINTIPMIKYVFIFLMKVKSVILNCRSNQVFQKNSNSLSSSQMQFERTTCSVSKEVLEMKTMLLQLKRVLKNVRIVNLVCV